MIALQTWGVSLQFRQCVPSPLNLEPPLFRRVSFADPLRSPSLRTVCTVFAD